MIDLVLIRINFLEKIVKAPVLIPNMARMVMIYGDLISIKNIGIGFKVESRILMRKGSVRMGFTSKLRLYMTRRD